MPRNRFAVTVALLAALTFAPTARAGAPAAPAATPDGARSTLADVMKKQPYLVYPGVPSQMNVLWQLSATAVSTIEWGTDTNYGGGSAQNPEYGIDHQHTFRIPSLAPATKYFYRVTTSGFAYTGSFTSAPTPDTQRIKFLAYGDTRTYPATHDAVAGAMVSAFNADPAYQTMALFMGDFVNSGNSETYWTNEFFSPTQVNLRAFLANMPLQATMGNHENSSPVLFTKYYPYPWVAGRYWSFDYGPVHVSVLDQYSSYTAGSPQLQWLAADLASTTKVWKIVLLHEPGWSTGNGHANNTAVQTLIQPLCEQYGVSIVFCGHNHAYGRAMVNGVAHVTTGGGGAPLEAPVAGQPNMVVTAMLNHFCKVAIDGGVLRLQAVNSTTGAIIDSFTIVRTVPDHVNPVLAVTSPAGGEAWDLGSAHDITWDASDNVGVDSVNVDVSLSGLAGPWQWVAHSLPNSGAYAWTLPVQASDSALVRVTAFDHALNSASALSGNSFRIVDPAADVAPVGHAVLSLSRPRPNPARGTTALRFSLPRAGHAELEIVDLGGRRLWQQGFDLPAGPHECTWSGQGARGEAGLYFVRLVTPWGLRSERLVWLR